MKCMLFSIVFLLGFVAIQAQPEAELLKKVKARMNTVNDYKASGTLKIDVSFINAPESKVLVYYKNPGKFAIRKTNGISLLPKGGVSINLNSLVPDKDYTLIPAGTTTLNGIPLKVLKLLPGDDKGDVVLTTLYIEEKNAVIRKSVVTTRENGTYEMELTYGRYTAYGLPDKVVFTFNTNEYKLPKGITFEYEKGGKKPTVPPNTKGRVELNYASYLINKGVSDKEFDKKD